MQLYLYANIYGWGMNFQKNEKFLGGDERGLSEYRQKGKHPPTYLHRISEAEPVNRERLLTSMH